MADVVVIGVGNRWRRDDIAGIAVLDELRERVGDEVELVESDGEPTRLIDAFERAPKVVMVDAVVTGADPGSVHRFTDAELPAQMGIGQSSHLVQLVETIELGRLLGKLPNGLVLIGIEATDFANGEGMTEAVAVGVHEAVVAVLRELAA
ncbi:MAG: hydrogenase maturation protease [Acidimicrobiia bacterium]|nr:hydrogenase maturation protease [Acidimicrobiia bacterium]MDJ0923115.1 hydrogenase maturation protease [Acidimicrobiia bacterium]